MFQLINKSKIIIIAFAITLFLGFLTFLTFIDRSFIELNDINLQNLLIIDLFVVLFFFLLILYEIYKIIKGDLIKQIKKEGFANPEVYKSTKNSFTAPTKKNPLMNVLLPEIQDQPKRKPAAPAFNKEVEREINEKTADPRLFLDLGDKIEFDGSMRNFYATANTTIPNDQRGFAEFCFGDMPSCKEGDGLQCTKDNPRYTNY